MDLDQNESKTSDAKGTESVARLYLLPQGPTEPRRSPSRIARWMGLVPYHGGLLSERTRIELNFAAGLLLLICLFEIFLWTFLFNAIYNRDVFYLGPRVAFAVLSAGFFGFAVFWFERQILTFDDQSKDRTSKLRWAMAVRLLYILGAAYVTSKPFELMLFREPITERAHQEALRQDVATRLLEVQESDVISRTDNQLSGGSVEGASRVAALAAIAAEEADRRNQILDTAASYDAQATRLDSQLREARAERDRLSRDVTYLSKVLAAARSRLSEATRFGSADQLQDLRIAEEQARSDHSAALRSVAVQEAAVQQLNEQLNSVRRRGQDVALQGDEAANRQLDYSTKAAEERLRLAQRADNQRLRLRQWVASVKALRPGQEKVDGDWVFNPQKPDFLDQLRILNDLRAGRPPMWTEGTEETRKLLQDEYGFADPKCTDGVPSGNRDPQAGPAGAKSAGLANDCRQIEAKKTVYAQLHTVSWLVALLIPSLMIAIKKFMLPEELRFYYSRRHQAEEGDPDALRATEVDDEVEANLREMRSRE